MRRPLVEAVHFIKENPMTKAERRPILCVTVIFANSAITWTKKILGGVKYEKLLVLSQSDPSLAEVSRDPSLSYMGRVTSKDSLKNHSKKVTDVSVKQITQIQILWET